jgi:anti-sigma regulatory factor (Ser/Thr protein kinase)
MTSNPANNTTATQLPTPTHHFQMRFSSTRRGARLARRLCGERFAAWGFAYGSDTHDSLALITAELCANAVLHGHVPGRDFRVDLTATEGNGEPTTSTTIRIAVTDTRGDRLPSPASHGIDSDATADRPDGRGLLLVAALADRWGCDPRTDSGPGKTVWAQLTLAAHIPAAAPIATPNQPTRQSSAS